MSNNSNSFVPDANEAMQENLERGEPVIFAAYGVIGAVLLLGGTGYVVDRWLGTGPWALLGGLAVGLSVALYVLLVAVRRR